MNKYALILFSDFTEDMLNGIAYPVNVNIEQYILIEYKDQPNPIGEGWVIFEGEDSNIRCAAYIEANISK